MVSEAFETHQGVHQGVVLSANLYKAFMNGLLEELRANLDGFSIGTIYVGVPTVADDVLLISRPAELQKMLNVHVSENYSDRERYSFNASKCEGMHKPDPKEMNE